MLALPTSGAIGSMFRSSPQPKDPVVQITEMKHMGGGEGPKRIKAQISDGELFGTAVLTTDVAHLITSEAVVINQLVTLKEYVINANAAGTKMCIIMRMEPVAAAEGTELTKIGGARR